MTSNQDYNNLTDNEWAQDVHQLLHKARGEATQNGDYDSARLHQSEAIATGLLAVATEQRQTNTLLRTYLDSVNPPAAHDEQLQQDVTDEQITGLAATLWQADPGNQASPAQRFQDDYAHRQDSYLAMARAALGLTDQPQKKDSRRP